MESNSEASCISDPNFAVICAFLERFASSCGITYPPFLDLQEMLENNEEVPQDLIELHIILLRKARRSVFREKWEKALVKFCHTYSTQDGWEIERFGYKNSRLEVKLRVLKTLLEGQFDLNCKFKTTINTLESNELRSKPVGKDRLGRIYWLQVDPTSNIRVYREDLDEESWTLVAKDRDTLVQLLQELSADDEPIENNLLNEDSSVSADIEKTVLDTGQENGVSENENIMTNGEGVLDEKDPLEIKNGDHMSSEINDSESHDEVVRENSKRVHYDAEEEDREVKKIKIEEIESMEMDERNDVGVEETNNMEMRESINVNVEETKAAAAFGEMNHVMMEEIKSEAVGSENSEMVDKTNSVETEDKNNAAMEDTSSVGVVETNSTVVEETNTAAVENDNNLENDDNVVMEETSDVREGESNDLGSEETNVTQPGEAVTADLSETGAVEVGEAIEEPVVHVYGEGSGAECDAGNPDKEDNKAEAGGSSNAGELTEPASSSQGEARSVEIKPTPKLWSIDTICGTGSFNHSGESSSKTVRSSQKNFSSFSIESVLEKKSDPPRLESPTAESPVVSVNVAALNNSETGTSLESVNQMSVQNFPVGDVSVKDVDSSVCNANSEDTAPSKDETSTENRNGEETGTTCSDLSSKDTENSTACAETRGETESKFDGPTEVSNQIDSVSTEETQPAVDEGVKAVDAEDTGKPMCTDDVPETATGDEPSKPETDEATAENKSTVPERGEKEEPLHDGMEVEEPASSFSGTTCDVADVKSNVPKLEDNKGEEQSRLESTEEDRVEDEDARSTQQLDITKPADPEPVINVQEAVPVESKTVTEDSKEVVEEVRGRGLGEEEEPLEESMEEETRTTTERMEVSENEPEEEVEKTMDTTSEEVTAVEESDRKDLPLENIPEESKPKESEPDQVQMSVETTAESREDQKDDGGSEEIADVAENETEAASSETKEEPDAMVVQPDTAQPFEGDPNGDISKVTEASAEVAATADAVGNEVAPKVEPVPETVNETPAEVPHENDELAMKTEVEDSTAEELDKPEGDVEMKPCELTPVEEMKEEERAASMEGEGEKPGVGEEEDVEMKYEVMESKEGEEAPKTDEAAATQNEEAENATQTQRPGKRRRNRHQSAEGEVLQTPARATRSAKRSVDEDPDAQKAAQPLQAKRDTRGAKRKSQDAESSELGEVKEGQVAEQPAEEKEVKKPQRRRGSNVNSASDENAATVQEEEVVSETPVKRGRARRKKSRDWKARRKVSTEEKVTEEQGNEVEEEKKPGEDEEAAANDEEASKKKSPKGKPKDGTPRTRALIPEREIKLLGLSNMEELPTVRQSRRIAQLKLKEEAERNRLKKLKEESKEEEEEEGKTKKKRKKKKGLKLTMKKKKKKPVVVESDDEDEEAAEAKSKPEKKRKKKKDKLKFDEHNPWISSSGSSSADEEEDEIEDEAHEEEEILFKSDHEFSPESDIEDPDYKPIKRARTAKVDSKDAAGAGVDSKYDDTACEKCGEKDHPEWILLCDKCDKGWHASCVRPALMVVPEGDWFCPPCEHTSLVQKLRESLVEYDRCQKQRENEELRKKRLAFVGISLDNVLPTKKDKKPKAVENEGESDETGSGNASGDESSSSGSSTSGSTSSDESSEPVYQLRERRTNITSYRYNEYDELIKSALQEEIEAVKGVGLGKGKDITNQVGFGGYGEYEEEEDEEDEEEANGDEVPEQQILPGMENAEQAQMMTINPEIPAEVLEAKPRPKPKKRDDDEDYEVEAGDDDDEDYNAEEEAAEEDEEEEEELADEVPPVVPQYDKKKKKSRSLNVRGLDFTSDEEEEDNSDSDFKGGSSEEESEFSLPSESESSDGVRRKGKNYDGPLRRSTRARTARYDKEFINDDSEDDAPRRKKSRNVWITSESSDSDRSWGRRKKRGGRSNNRSSASKRKTKSKTKKKKTKKRAVDSENEDGERGTPKKPRSRKIKYGGLDDLDEEQVLTRRTRGKKINYQEMNASDSDDEVVKRRPRAIGDSDEEFVAEKEKSDDSDIGQDEPRGKAASNGKAVSKKSIMRKMKKRTKVIPDPDDFSEDDLLEDEELDEFAEELGNLDEEEENMLEKMLNEGDVPIHELKSALKKVKERRKERPEGAKPYPPIPEHMENPGLTPRFPKIEKMPPGRMGEVAAQLGMPPAAMAAAGRSSLLGKVLKDGEPAAVPDLTRDQPNLLLLNEQKPDSKEGMMNVQPPPYPYPADVGGPMVNPHGFPLNNRPPIPPYSSFQGMIPAHGRMPPEYPHPNIPTTVLGLENNGAQKAASRKTPAKAKRKNEEGLSPHPDSGEENSGDGDSPQKRRGRGRGKKQLLTEPQTKPELGISTVQAPTQFPPQGLPPEGGSVITRMLNTPQGPQPFPFSARPPFRPPYPNALRPPLNAASPSRLRSPAPGIFHPAHPLDPAPSGMPLPQTKPLPGGFARAPILPRYPSDPGLRPPFPSQSPPPRTENYPFANYYGPFAPPMGNSDEGPFHSPNFPGPPFDEHHQPGPEGPPPGKAPFEEEAGGEFGGLASYFASQREDDLDT